MAMRTLRRAFLTVPGIGVSLLPKLACPMCWPLYAGVLSSVGLGFLISERYLLSFTIAFLILTLAVLGFRAKRRRGYGPTGLGLVASAAIIVGKFGLDSNSMTYGGVAALVIAAVWNAWPVRQPIAAYSSCSDTSVQIDGVRQGRI
jgi:mercuric ion transport protein